MATRTQAREAVAGLVYAYSCGNTSIIEVAPQMLQAKRIKNKQRDFAMTLLRGVLEHFESLSGVIGGHLREWEFERLGQMEKSILRLGAYEILYTQTDTPVIINEAVELAKTYGEDNAPRLVNAVLDALANHKPSINS